MKKRDGNILAVIRREALGQTRVVRSKRIYSRKLKHNARHCRV